MDIGKLFGHAWGLFTKDIGPLIVTTIVAALAAGIPAAILLGGVLASGVSGEWTFNEDGTITGAGDVNWGLVVVGSILVALIVIFITVPFYASMVSIMVRRVREGRVAEYGDMFAGFRQYGQVVSTYLLIGLIVGLLSITFIGIPVAIWLGVLWTYAVIAVVDRRVGFGESTGFSKQLVKGSGWWMTFLALFVASIVFGVVSGLLNMIPVVGSIAAGLMYPLMFAYLVAMYFQATGEVQLVENALAGLPPAAAGVGPYGAPPAGGPYAPPAPPAPPAGTAYAPPRPRRRRPAYVPPRPRLRLPARRMPRPRPRLPPPPSSPPRARRARVSRHGRPRPTRSRASRRWRRRSLLPPALRRRRPLRRRPGAPRAGGVRRGRLSGRR